MSWTPGPLPVNPSCDGWARWSTTSCADEVHVYRDAASPYHQAPVLSRCALSYCRTAAAVVDAAHAAAVQVRIPSDPSVLKVVIIARNPDHSAVGRTILNEQVRACLPRVVPAVRALLCDVPLRRREVD